MRHYQQLTYEQRCQISALKKRGCSQREIAACIGASQSTVTGGGCFLLLYCEPENHQKLQESLNSLREFEFEFDEVGSTMLLLDH